MPDLSVSDPHAELRDAKRLILLLVGRLGGSAMFTPDDLASVNDSDVVTVHTDDATFNLVVRAGVNAEIEQSYVDLRRQWPDVDGAVLRAWSEERVARR